MQSDTVKDFFGQLISSTQSLKNGAQIIKNKIKDKQQFVLDIIEYISSEQEPSKDNLKQYFHIITLVHPVLIQVFSQLNEKTQQDIRGGLLNCVVTLYIDLKCVAALGLLIRQIIEIDSLDPWLEPFVQLLNWVSSDQSQIVQAGIQFFIHILKETQYNQSNNDLPLHKMAAPLLQVLYQLFANSQLSETIRQKLLYLVLQLIKTFSIYDGFNDAIVKQSFDSTYEIWMSFFISTLQTTVYSNIRIKKYIMKIVVIIFRDMQKYLSQKQKQQPAQLYTIWQFCYKALPLHLWANVWQKDLLEYKNKDNFQNQQQIPTKSNEQYFGYYDDDNQALINQPQSLVLTILQFISVLTSIPQLNTTIKISIHHLTNVLFHFMLMPQSDTVYWKTTSHQFLSNNIATQYQVTVRNKTIGILNQLIQKCGDYAIQAILMVSEKFLLNIPESQTTESVKEIMENVIDIKTLPEISSGIYDSPQKLINLIKLSSCDVRNSLHVSGQTWKKMEVALVVLGRFAQDIIVFQSKQQGAFDIQTFIKGLIKQVRDDQFYALLKGQSLYCLTRFTEIISIKYKSLFTQLAYSCLICLRKKNPLSLKVISCRALTLFLRKIQKHKIQFSQQILNSLNSLSFVQSLMTIPLQSQITNIILQTIIQVKKNKQLNQISQRQQLNQLYPQYLLSIFHKNINHSSTVQLFFTLLQQVCKQYNQYYKILQIFIKFIQECLKSYANIIGSQEQIKYLKNSDIQLILIVLKITNVLIIRGFQIWNTQNTEINKGQFQTSIKEKFLGLISIFSTILKSNNDIPIHIQVTICLKNIIKLTSQEIKANSSLIPSIVQCIKTVLKVPKDKSFQSASIYAGNLSILAFEKVFPKTNYQILQQAVLKVFRSRTPSVIQSLVLIYSRLINMHTEKNDPFKMNMKNQITDIIDFLSSFSIQNRMGLKILIDKWLLQQSLFRGKYTKISTFMALSKLFLLGDKRVDNLLVIGFNPSHTNVCIDVNAPLKILATLIRCLDNQKGFQRGDQEQQQFDDDALDGQGKQQQKTVQVTLQKFKQQKNQDQQNQGQRGGLSDRQNQQGSTCYMSAMLQFYDDGQQCDQTTQQDLIFLSDSSTNFTLAEYLVQFFNYLIQNKKQYFKECLKGILKQDVKTLQKYVKID